MLTDTEQAILDTERLRFKHAGAKESHIRTELGLHPVSYYQQLRGLAFRDDVYAAHPMLLQGIRSKLRTVRRGSR